MDKYSRRLFTHRKEIVYKMPIAKQCCSTKKTLECHVWQAEAYRLDEEELLSYSILKECSYHTKPKGWLKNPFVYIAAAIQLLVKDV